MIAVRRDRPGSMNASAMSRISHVLDPLASYARTVQNAPFISFMHAVAKNVLADLLLHCFLHISEVYIIFWIEGVYFSRVVQQMH